MKSSNRSRVAIAALASILTLSFAAAPPALAQYRQHVPNNMATCESGDGPAMRVTVNGIRHGSGTLRVQSYRSTSADWLQSGRWLTRTEVPARSGTMTFCVPLPAAGTYGIAVRHDRNGNGKTDIRSDGGGMSNNPSINIFNLGKPSYRSTAVSVGEEVKSITINMRYM
ncbi:MAG: DUF2141 domain-containing protein [Novosphingobium sp.]